MHDIIQARTKLEDKDLREAIPSANKQRTNLPMSIFREKVYALAKLIPRGKVVTYAQLAALAGAPGAARAVGTCMKNNPDLSTIPCHRVIASDGGLGGYSSGQGLLTKLALLKKEGVHFISNRQVDLAASQWRPEA